MSDEEFEELRNKYAAIKDERVGKRLRFYEDRVDSKRVFAQWTRGLALFLSLAIPLVVTFTPSCINKDLIVSVMALLIALGSGLEGLHQWDRTWREYSTRIVQIETLIGYWEIKVARARQLSDAEKVSQVLADATQQLVASVEQAVLAEMDTFFSERSKAQPSPSPKT